MKWASKAIVRKEQEGSARNSVDKMLGLRAEDLALVGDHEQIETILRTLA